MFVFYLVYSLFLYCFVYCFLFGVFFVSVLFCLLFSLFIQLPFYFFFTSLPNSVSVWKHKCSKYHIIYHIIAYHITMAGHRVLVSYEGQHRENTGHIFITCVRWDRESGRRRPIPLLRLGRVLRFGGRTAGSGNEER